MKLSEALNYWVGALSLISTLQYLDKFFYYCCSGEKENKPYIFTNVQQFCAGNLAVDDKGQHAQTSWAFKDEYCKDL